MRRADCVVGLTAHDLDGHLRLDGVSIWHLTEEVTSDASSDDIRHLVAVWADAG